MTLTTFSQGDEQAERYLKQFRATLRDLTDDLSRLNDSIREGDQTALREAAKTLAAMQAGLRVAYDLEARFEERTRKKAGIVNSYALDLDAARASIGERLDRLRAAADPGSLSGGAK